jgi:hypothetical protein
MPRTARRRSDHQPKWATTKWVAALHREMQTLIGQQLKARYAPPQELSSDMTALLMRIDEQGSVKA